MSCHTTTTTHHHHHHHQPPPHPPLPSPPTTATTGAALCLVESGGDNLAANYSHELADYTIYVIDVAGGDKVPRKGGPGITRSDLVVINKIDLAPMVGASLEVMDRDARKMRGSRPFLFSNLKVNKGLPEIASFILHAGGLAEDGVTAAMPILQSIKA